MEAHKPDFVDICTRCHGMLAPAIYREIYLAARDRDGGDIVEVGTAKGAATVALALGLRDSGKPGHVYTFGRAEPHDRARKSFAKFGVSDLIHYYEGEVDETINALPADLEIGALVVDADGRIDRDFRALFSRVMMGAPIVIDDCRDRVRLRPTAGGFRIDGKMQLCHDLVSYYSAEGVLAPGALMKDTLFTRKAGEIDGLDPLAVLRAYQRLVFTKAANPLRNDIRASTVRLLDRLAPQLSGRLRARYRDRVIALQLANQAC